jgi:hypothetical protein
LKRAKSDRQASSLSFSTGLGVLDSLHNGAGLHPGDIVELCGDMGSGKTLVLMLASARMLCETREQTSARCVYFDLEYQLSIPHFVRLLASTLVITLREEKMKRMKKKMTVKKNASSLTDAAVDAAEGNEKNVSEKGEDDVDVITADIITSMLQRIDIVRPRSIRELSSVLEKLSTSSSPSLSMTTESNKGLGDFIALICLDGFCSSWQYQLKAKIAGLDDPGLRRALLAPTLKRRSSSMPPGISSSSSSSSSPSFDSSSSASANTNLLPTLLPTFVKCKESAYQYESQMLNRLSQALQATRRYHRHCKIIWSRRLSFEGPSRIARSLRFIGIPRLDVAKHLQGSIGRAAYAAEALNRIRPLPAFDPFTGPSFSVTGTKSEWISHPINYFNFGSSRERGFGSRSRIPPETPVSLDALSHAITPSLVPYSLDQLVTAQVFLSAAQLPISSSFTSTSSRRHPPPPPPPALNSSRIKSTYTNASSVFLDAKQLLSSPTPLPPALPLPLLLSLKKRIIKSSSANSGAPAQESPILFGKRKEILNALMKKERDEQLLHLSTDAKLLQFPVTVNVLGGITAKTTKMVQLKDGIQSSSLSHPASSSSSSSSALPFLPSSSSLFPEFASSSHVSSLEKSILDIKTSYSERETVSSSSSSSISSSSSTLSSSLSIPLLFSTAIERQATTTALLARLVRSTSSPYRSSNTSISGGKGGSDIPECILFVTKVLSKPIDDND